MKKISFIIIGLFLGMDAVFCGARAAEHGFLSVQGVDIVTPQGKKFDIKGTNLGNWLNPEGYMFGFQTASSPAEINRMFCQMVGPDYVNGFWTKFKDNYITRADIEYIASTGANTIRLPFHYKLFTDEDYMGLTKDQDGFARIDSIVEWCRGKNLYVILDMHDAPAGQTGDNIDDSFGYPWLFESETAQDLTCKIWSMIATRYKNEPVILGYDLLNEPIATYFDNKDELNTRLEPLYRRIIAAVRKVDAKHIIMLGGAQWNGNFAPFSHGDYGKNVMFTCHRYGGGATKEAIKAIIDFRDAVRMPMYMGEIGHNTDAWMADFVKVLNENNIGWTFWPYKKVEKESFVCFSMPQGWSKAIAFSESSRNNFGEVRAARPPQAEMREAMRQLLDSVKFGNCKINKDYIKAISLKP